MMRRRTPSKKESIKRCATEAIEKVIVNTYSNDLTDDDISSSLASSLASEAPKMETNVDGNGYDDKEPMHYCNNECNRSNQS